MKILELYKAILASTGAIVDEDGLVSMTTPDSEPIPFIIGDKRLALPTKDLLDAGGFNANGALIAFHPMCENVMLDTSPVLEKFEMALAFRLRTVFNLLVHQLVGIASDHSYHKKLKMAAHGLLSAMPNASERTATDINKVLAKGATTGPRKLISLFVRKGGEYGGEKVSRLGKFYPSIVDGLDKEKRTLWDVSLRKADVEDFLSLMEYLLPEYNDPERYSAPSNSPVAPSLQALLKAFYRAANQLNKVVELFKDHLTAADDMLIPLDWYDHVHDFTPYRAKIPTLPGNDGAEGVKKAVPPREERAVEAPTGYAHQRTTTAPAPHGGASSVDSLLGGLREVSSRRNTQGGWGNRGGRDPYEDLPPWAQPQQQQQAGWNRSGGGYGGGRGGYGGRGGGRGAL